MNLRIRELAEQAGGYLSQSYEHDGKLILSGEDIVQKFAELIVKECFYQVADVRIENDFEPVGDAALVQALAGIKKIMEQE